MLCPAWLGRAFTSREPHGEHVAETEDRVVRAGGLDPTDCQAGPLGELLTDEERTSPSSISSSSPCILGVIAREHRESLETRNGVSESASLHDGVRNPGVAAGSSRAEDLQQAQLTPRCRLGSI